LISSEYLENLGDGVEGLDNEKLRVSSLIQLLSAE
jgi:hypothetical protein